jgi:hypothetical protein
MFFVYFSKIRLQGFNIRYVKWAPVGNALVYVDYDNNIYYRSSALSQDDKLTDNGIADEVRCKFVGNNHHTLPEAVFIVRLKTS